MFKYLIKRLLLFIPIIGIMSLLIFHLAQSIQEDRFIQNEESNSRTTNQNVINTWKYRNVQAKKLGFNLPIFYWSIYRKSSIDTLNRIVDIQIRESLNNLAYDLGSWDEVNSFFSFIKVEMLSMSNVEQLNLTQILKTNLLDTKQPRPFFKYPRIETKFRRLIKNKITIDSFSITFNWNGFNNQYHNWFSALLRGDFGKSMVDGSSINEKLKKAIYWTVLMSIISILISITIAILAAFYTSFNSNNRISIFIDKIILLFYAIPNFWAATLLILFFASGDYFNWFPSYGLGIIRETDSLYQTFSLRFSHLLLPILTMSYGPIAIIYKQLKNSIELELQKDYIKTAKAKGLTKTQIQKKQLFKNACFPLITLIGKIIPALLSGAFIVEYIYSIPGMGKVSVEALLSRDFSIIYILLLIATFMSMMGLLISDLLYAIADPRVQFSSKTKLI